MRRKRHQRSKREIDVTIEALKQDERVKYYLLNQYKKNNLCFFAFLKIEHVLVGEPIHREKREVLTEEKMIKLYKKNLEKNEKPKDIDISNLQISFNDVLYSKQWYLVS